MKYIGVKIVEAVPMTYHEWIKETEGKAPMARDYQPGYKVTYPSVNGSDPHTSWCPADAFEQHNRPIDGMTFGHALESVKNGSAASRKAWKGKRKVWLHKGKSFSFPFKVPYSCQQDFRGMFMDENEEAVINYENVLCLFKNGTVLLGWTPSAHDILAEDWYLIEE